MKNPGWDKVRIQRKELVLWGAVLLALIFLFAPIAVVQFICLFFIFILTGSRLYTECLVRNIRVNRIDQELRVFRHEWIHVEIKVENQGLLPAFMLVAGDMPGQLAVFKMTKTFCTLTRGSWILINWQGLCSNRGAFSLGPAVIRGADPLGLFPFHLTAKETTKLFVYPSLRSVTIKALSGIPLGNMTSTNPLYEDITRSRSLRPYNPGDEPRRINWKASAHASRGAKTLASSLLVNEYDATKSSPLMVFLNMEISEYKGKMKNAWMERTIEAAAALCLDSSRNRQEMGIIIYTPDSIAVIKPSAFSLIPILERLAVFNWSVKTTAPNVLSEDTVLSNDTVEVRTSWVAMLDQGKRLPYGTRYVYTGPDLSDEAYINLNILKKYHLTLEYLIISERKLSFLVPGNSPRYQIKENGYEII